MEYSTIYESYRNDRVSFENTLRLIGDLIEERLNPEYNRIWVQASNAGRVKFCITVFPVNQNERYRLLFQEYPNFRNWRGNVENIGPEVANIENIIETLRNGVLSGIIS
jgi:hypothetical protein